ncbi:hypothetical protein IMG5_152470 [Ichthyophthirius multifiliis]|uniref:C2 domain-containing protein n=1 Tax=Ichthyophthirius multifiliis TaxID=5932 RepID=G0QYV2_ICHMU|nr:hypothetical protein IMG5_152470 [Ichthyophthirius multifiliis]EGR29597.1 hypothetical protein IMG5_152470 [Ichthyophthirius multifiliis]|eukprot:XP_004030833.1 hypothetical protein IMG5_152470 [Ichthyophthirius multifiliis]
MGEIIFYTIISDPPLYVNCKGIGQKVQYNYLKHDPFDGFIKPKEECIIILPSIHKGSNQNGDIVAKALVFSTLQEEISQESPLARFYKRQTEDIVNIFMKNEDYDLYQRLELYISCENLPNLDITSKTDPLVICYVIQDKNEIERHRTEVIANELNPKFARAFFIQHTFNKNFKLKFVVYNVDAYDENNEEHIMEEIGEVQCEINDIIQGNNYVFGGTKIQFIIGIDFTQMPNNIYETDTEYQEDLKKLKNEYVQALKLISSFIQYYQISQYIPVYGIGARLQPSYTFYSNCFAISGHFFDPKIDISNSEKLVQAYLNTFKKIKQSGTLIFSDILKLHQEYSKNYQFTQEKQNYFVLILLSHNELLQSDIEETKANLFYGCENNVSVINIGIGKGDFQYTSELKQDSEGFSCLVDIQTVVVIVISIKRLNNALLAIKHLNMLKDKIYYDKKKIIEQNKYNEEKKVFSAPQTF